MQKDNQERSEKTSLPISIDSTAFTELDHSILNIPSGNRTGYWDWNPATGEFNLSDEFYSIYGIPKKESLENDETLKKAIHPDDLHCFIAERGKALDSSDNINIEYRIVRPDGQIRLLRQKGNIIRHEDKPVKIFGVIHDISHQNKSIQEGYEKNNLFDVLFENSMDAVAILQDGNYLRVNPAYLKLFGYTDLSELQGKPILENIAQNCRPQVIDFVTKKYHGENITDSLQTTGLKQNGSKFEFEARIKQFSLNDQDFTIAIIKDISERIVYEQALKDSDARWKFALEGTNDGLWDWNIEANQIFFSENWKSMLGFLPNEIANDISEWRKHVHPDDLQNCNIDIYKHLEGKTNIYRNVHRIICKDGTLKWVLERGKVTSYNKSGRPARMIGTYTDLTERVEIENKLNKLNNDKSRFISILAHDLRNPFNIILGFSDLLIEKLRSMPIDSIEEQLRLINITAHETHNLLENLLSWARSQSGHLEYQPENFYLTQLIENIFALSTEMANKKNIVLLKNYEDDFPVYADANMISTVVRNLISNAIKFTPEHGQVTVQTQKINQNWIQVSVIDTGIGIDSRNLESIFQVNTKYTRTGTNNEIGSGLGLILCKEFIDKHGGEISVSSSAGKGSIFSFTLPAGNSSSIKKEKENSIQSLPEKDTGDDTVINLNVLAAEDNQVNQLLLQKVFASKGHTISIFENGKTLLDHLEHLSQSDKIDIILLDLEMPELNGVQTIKKIRQNGLMENHKETRIFILTGNDLTKDWSDFEKMGFHGYLAKPFKYADFLKLYRSVAPDINQ